MTHLGERITDFVFGEMSPLELSTAQEHLRQCSECTGKVEELQRTRTLLQAVPDMEPPRPIVFEVERKSQARPWLWKWVTPAAAAVAASLLTAVLMSPSEAWLTAELEKRDRAHEMDLQRVHSEIAYWERQQRAATRETMDTARTIQLLAQKYRPKTDGD